MSRELVPITEFPVAAALPDYLGAERIGVDVDLIGRVAQWGCFKPDVQITAYFGETTSYEVGVNGMAGTDVATAAVAGKVSAASRSQTSFKEAPPALYGDSSLSVLHHGVPKLNTSLNVAEIQQRLQDRNTPMRDVRAWSKELDGGMSEALRSAVRQNILGGVTSYREAMDVALEITYSNLLINALTWIDGYEAGAFEPLIFATCFAIARTNLRKARRENLLDPTHAETCYSLIPGLHLDRYAVVEVITRARRLIRPIK